MSSEYDEELVCEHCGANFIGSYSCALTTRRLLELGTLCIDCQSKVEEVVKNWVKENPKHYKEFKKYHKENGLTAN